METLGGEIDLKSADVFRGTRVGGIDLKYDKEILGDYEYLRTMGFRRGHDDGSEDTYSKSHMWPTVKAVGPCRDPYPGKHSDPQMEVFSLRINKINDGCRNIHGKFMLDCNVSVQCMFKREKPVANDESSDPLDKDKEGDELQLIGPNTNSIFASDRLNLEFILMNETSIPCNCLVHWDAEKNSLYNVPIYGTIKGQFGSVTVNYAVYDYPISAKIQVVLLEDANNISMNEEDSEESKMSPRPHKRAEMSANVYGQISARNSFLETAEDRSVLFNREKASSVQVKHGEHIPLSRAIVCFPYPASLILEVDLWDGDDNSGVPIAKRRVEFLEPEFCSTTVMKISPNVQLNVTWALYFHKDQAFI